MLNALFGAAYPNLAEKLVRYRRGFDGKAGTSDDKLFAKGSYVLRREGVGLATVVKLENDKWSDPLSGLTSKEWKRVRELVKDETLIATSDVYRLNVTSQVRKVQKNITAVIKFESKAVKKVPGFGKTTPPPEITYLYWHET